MISVKQHSRYLVLKDGFRIEAVADAKGFDHAIAANRGTIGSILISVQLSKSDTACGHNVDDLIRSRLIHEDSDCLHSTIRQCKPVNDLTHPLGRDVAGAL